jgi:branched-chain amino acid aminotransferase
MEKMKTKLDTDYIVRINMEEADPENASVSIFDHGFLFGDSIYEVVRTVDGRLYALKEHLERLRRSCKRVSLELPWSDSELETEIHRALGSKSWDGESYVRLIITRGVGRIDLMPQTCLKPNLIVVVKEIPLPPAELYETGLVLCVTDVRRNPREAMDPGIKSGNYLNNVLALIEAREKGADDSVMLNANDLLTECTTSNIFLVKDGVVKTPSLECGILPGITRMKVLEIALNNKIGTEEIELTLDDLESADEIFITGSIKGIVPVKQIIGKADWEGEKVPGPVTARLRELFHKSAGI